jgi:uncharacterized iron-regulated membrane protein
MARRPWLRRAALQVHLWLGIGLGFYVVLLCLTGSALVYRIEIERALRPAMPVFEPDRPPLGPGELARAAERTHPGWEATRVGTRIRPYNPTLEVWLERDGRRLERLFDPYTGADLGDARPLPVDVLDWLADLHDRLLLRDFGSRLNAAGSALVTLLAIAGAVVWWPGTKGWRRAITVRRGSNWIRFTWDLHNALGFWFFAFVAMWGVSGVYLAYPEPFAAVVDRYSDPATPFGERAGDIVLSWLARLHFGRFPEAPLLQALWVPLGLVPVVMAVTGALVWWNRVWRRRRPARAA